MNFNDHSRLHGKHAILSASKWNWINYDRDRMIDSYSSMLASLKGTELHAMAELLIKNKQLLPDDPRTLNMYVNDAIYFGLQPEQILYYSPNCFGTADAIGFDNGFLRIHDLKTGVTPAHIEQLEIYAALFCLEYLIEPNEIDMELRIYQNDDILTHKPEPSNIVSIMIKIDEFDSLIEELKSE